MRRRMRRKAVAGAGLLAAGLFGLAFPIAVANAAPVSATDSAGDTVTEAVEEAINAPRVDIVATDVDSRPEALVFSVRVKQLVDPMSDPNWASEDTALSWTIDVNGDGKRDYIVEYAIDPATHKLATFQYRTGGGSGPADTDSCDEAPATYNPDTGYSVAIDPKCLGNPGSLSYRVAMSYDTDATLDSAETAVDASPGSDAWTGPVPVTLPAGVTPGTFPTHTPPSPAPSSAKPEALTPGQPAAPAPTGPKSIKPQQAASGARPSSPSPGPAQAAPALARTGLYDRTMRVAGFALGIALIGAGLLVANLRSRPSTPTRDPEIPPNFHRKFWASA